MEFLEGCNPEYPVYFNYDQDPYSNASSISNALITKDMRQLDDENCITGVYLTD